MLIRHSSYTITDTERMLLKIFLVIAASYFIS